MRFEPNEEQRLLCESARKFFAREFPLASVRKLESEGQDAFLPLYRKMGEFGYLGIGVPEAAGGSGGSWIDLCLFAEEAGRALVPTLQIASVVIGAQALLAFGDDAQCTRIPALVTGESVMALAWIEQDAASREPAVATRASPRGQGMELDGAKRYVEGYLLASELMVSACDPAGTALLLLVPRDATGIDANELVLTSGDKVHHLRFTGVALPPGCTLRADWDAWLRIIDGAKIIAGAWAVGAARAVLEMAVRYAEERKQFGRPIGSFQAVQHRLADAGIVLEQASAMVRYAAWVRDQPGSWQREAAMAKLMAGRAVRATTHAAMLTHGGYGFMEEFDIQLYFRRAKQFEHLIEDAVLQREIIADDDGDDLSRADR